MLCKICLFKSSFTILQDLHRTGCSLFSGTDSEHNQALLKQVLLAYARWNRGVGYCQGFNMLAAIILEVMDQLVQEHWNLWKIETKISDICSKSTP